MGSAEIDRAKVVEMSGDGLEFVTTMGSTQPDIDISPEEVVGPDVYPAGHGPINAVEDLTAKGREGDYDPSTYRADQHLVKAEDVKEYAKELIIKKLRKDPNPESLREVFAETAQEVALEAMKAGLSEAERSLWFPDADVRVNLEKVTADLRDTDQWAAVLQKVKDGVLTVEEAVDYVTLSHIAIMEEVDPLKVHERQVRQGLQGRTGVRLLGGLTDAVSTSIAQVAQAFGDVLELQAPVEIKALPAMAQTEEELVAQVAEGSSVIPVDMEIHTELAKAVTAEELKVDFRTRMLQEMFAGEILYDKRYDVTYQELRDKLEDENDYEFDSQRAFVVHAGTEYMGPIIEGVKQYNGPEHKRFVLYLVWLSNLAEGVIGTHSEDRSVTKYVIDEDITDDQFQYLMVMVQERYASFVAGRTEHCRFDMGWVTHEDLHKSEKRRTKAEDIFKQMERTIKDIEYGKKYDLAKLKRGMRIIKTMLPM